MTGTPFDPAREPPDEISPTEIACRANTLRLAWCPARNTNPTGAETSKVETGDLDTDVREVVAIPGLGDDVPLARSLSTETPPTPDGLRSMAPPVSGGAMTTDSTPLRPRSVTRPQPPATPDADQRGARVRPYYRLQEHRSAHDSEERRAVLMRVLAGLRALNPQPTPQSAAPRPTPPVRTVHNAAASTTRRRVPVATSAGDTPPESPARIAAVQSRLGRELMPIVRAVLARRPEAALPAAAMKPSPDSIRTQPLSVVETRP